MKKIIKKSTRGLTFSFEGKSTNFNIGDKYRYIIDPDSNKVYIIPSNNKEALTVSKKKVGTKIKSLIDLRAKTVLDTFDAAELLEVNIEDNKIIISILKASIQSKIISSITNNIKFNKVVVCVK